MKKILASCIVFTSIMAASMSFGFAAPSTVTERPDIKIEINGDVGTYSNVPIIVNNRTLLPLRAILVNLGVQNDDQHIIWNAADRTATVNKGDTKVVLKIDKNTASVNGSTLTLDVAPIIYKNRTYIPARFVSQSFGMKVFWDATSNTALIRDEAGFNQVKDILAKTDAAMNSAERFKISETGHTGLKILGKDITSDRTMDTQADNKQKIISAVMNSNLVIDGSSQKSTAQLVSKDRTGYIKGSDQTEWTNFEMSDDEYSKAYEYHELKDTDILSAGLVIGAGSEDNEIKLSGKVNFKDYLGGLFNIEEIKEYVLNDVYTEITLDKNTYQIKKIYLKCEGTTTIQDSNDAKLQVESTSNYSDYDGNFTVTLPEGIS